MFLDIVIPSYNRRQKLENCLNSIFLSLKYLNEEDINKVNIFLYFSDEFEFRFYKDLFMGLPNIKVKLLEKYRVPNFWNNHLLNMQANAMMYCTDDILFHDSTLLEIYKEFYEGSDKYLGPDTDRVLGVSQANLPEGQALDSAYGVIGKDYVKRFLNGQVWCPAYNRFFCDQELGEYAKSINKFKFCPQIKIDHLHPCVDMKYKDSTHDHVRIWLRQDKMTHQTRKDKGLLWGKTYEV